MDARVEENDCWYNSGQEHPVSTKLGWSKNCGCYLGNARWPVLRRHVDRVVAARNGSTPGSYTEVEIPAN
jgi:hypothetical protein